MNKFRTVAAMLIMAAAIVSCGKDDTTTPVPAEYTVTFDPDGGTPAPGDQTIAKGGKITEPPAMTKTDHTFDGWYKDATKWDFVAGTVTADMTLKARWTPAAEKPQATLRYETVPYIAAGEMLKTVGKRATDGALDNLVYTISNDDYNAYFFLLGHIKSAPLAYRPAIYYNGTTPITVGYSSSNVTETSIANSITEMNEHSVSKSSTYQNTNEVGAKVGFETAGIAKIWGAKFTAEVSYGHTWTTTEEEGTTTTRSTSNTYETSSVTASEITDEISVTIGNNNEPAGLYRFSLFSTTDVYFVIVTDRAKTEIKESDIIYCARPVQFWALDYEPQQDGAFGKTASGELLQIPEVTISELPDVAECEHEWGPWIATVAATDKTEGEEARTCSLCGRVETRVVPVLRTGTFNLNTGTWTSGNANGKASYSNGALTVNDQAKIIVTSNNVQVTGGPRIVVNGNAIITLKDLRMNGTSGKGSPITLNAGANLTIRLEGNTNRLWADYSSAGIRTIGGTLTITGPGSLEVHGGSSIHHNHGSGAGIGGDGGTTGRAGQAGGTVIFESGTVLAVGGFARGADTEAGGGGGAGIGGGGGVGWREGTPSQPGGAGGRITIYEGANVTANIKPAGVNSGSAHGGGMAMSYGGGGGGGTKGDTSIPHAPQGAPGTIDDRRNP